MEALQRTASPAKIFILAPLINADAFDMEAHYSRLWLTVGSLRAGESATPGGISRAGQIARFGPVTQLGGCIIPL
jgi:hypothetical protein